MPNCDELPRELHLDSNARISLTDHNGIVSKYREANPLGFLKKEPLPECPTVFKELGLSPDEMIL